MTVQFIVAGQTVRYTANNDPPSRYSMSIDVVVLTLSYLCASHFAADSCTLLPTFDPGSIRITSYDNCYVLHTKNATTSVQPLTGCEATAAELIHVQIPHALTCLHSFRRTLLDVRAVPEDWGRPRVDWRGPPVAAHACEPHS